MSRAQRTFTIAFLAAFVPQLIVWAVYFLGFSDSGSETTFQKNVLWFYWPIVFPIERLQDAIGWSSWVGFGLRIFFGPLIGALVYSLLIACTLCVGQRRNLPDQSAT